MEAALPASSNLSSRSGSPLPAVFALRIFTTDHYQGIPLPGLDPVYSKFRGNEVQRVPVLRIFGSTPAGQTVCLHLHGSFPYLLIPAEDGLSGPEGPLRLALALDKAINVSLGRSCSSRQHVHDVTVVSVLPMYGFHQNKQKFLLVRLYSPILMERASNLLRGGAVLGRPLQPHHAHLPFHLQAFVDHSLYGMSLLHFCRVHFRRDSLSQENCFDSGNMTTREVSRKTSIEAKCSEEVPLSQKLWQIESLPSEMLMEKEVERMSTCQLEVDALVSDIISQSPSGGQAANPGLQSIWEEEWAEGAEAIPPKLPFFPGRPEHLPPSESDVFYLKRLEEKLGRLSPQSLQSPSVSSPTPALSGSGPLLDSEDEEVAHMLSQMRAAVLGSEEGKDKEDELDDAGMHGTLVEENSLLGSQLPMPEEPAEEVCKGLEDEGEEEEEEEVQSREMSQCLGFGDEENEDEEVEELHQLDGAWDSSSSSTSSPDEFFLHTPPPPSTPTPKQSPRGTPGKKKRRKGEYGPLDLEVRTSPLKKKKVPEPNSTVETEEEEGSGPTEDYSECSLKDHQGGYKDALWNLGHWTATSDSDALEESPPRPWTPVEPQQSSSIVMNHGEVIAPRPEMEVSKASSIVSSFHGEGETQTVVCNQEEEHIERETTLVRSSQGSSLGVLSFYGSQGSQGIHSFYEFSTLAEEGGGEMLEIGTGKKMGARAKALGSEVHVMCPLRPPPSYNQVRLWVSTQQRASGAVVHSTPLQPSLTPSSGNSGATSSTQKATVAFTPAITPIPRANISRKKKVGSSRRLSFPEGQEPETQSPLSSCPSSPIPMPTPLQRQLLDSNCRRRSSLSGIEGPSPDVSAPSIRLHLQQARDTQQCEHLTLLSLEAHVVTRGELLPDPSKDSLSALFWYVFRDEESVSGGNATTQSGALVVDPSCSIGEGPSEEKRTLKLLDGLISGKSLNSLCVQYVGNERQLLEALVALVRKWDPDVLVGYEVEMASWGLVVQRAAFLQMDLRGQLSRVPPAPGTSTWPLPEEGGTKLPVGLGGKVNGREVLDVWRLLRHEVSLQSYTLESVAYQVLGERFPLPPPITLSKWWGHHASAPRVAQHYLNRCSCTLRLLAHLDLPHRTAELARLFGILWFEVLSRGSQFRVESMMLRLAKGLDRVAVSPGIHQRAQMRAPQCLQLIMEPRSGLYRDPVVVLDFQSLYPSIIIAYNYCFSTCLGRLEHLGSIQPFPFGCTSLQVVPSLLQKLLHLQSGMHFSPCGVAFVGADVRRGVLPIMLQEILATRLQVKAALKRLGLGADEKARKKLLHARQLGLKLIANVTYGYTAANFSGRMPCIEVGDSVVSKARETLERAIAQVKAESRWGAEVIYGDTDSMFVLLRGRTREEAFRIGAEMAQEVTRTNPHPVELKLEKVYQPCLLQTKKRYVGMAWQDKSQQTPTYDAKGIETVRRDGCPALSKVLEKSLRLLFSGEQEGERAAREYVHRQAEKILQGRLSLQDATFAKEFRGRGGYRPGACVPALEICKQLMRTDPRAEPRTSERVPYVIVQGPPSAPLIRLVRRPQELLLDPSLRLNGPYYLHRVLLPSLQRCFGLLGQDVSEWVADLPSGGRYGGLSWKRRRQGHGPGPIQKYFPSAACKVCGQLCGAPLELCGDCQQEPLQAAAVLGEQLRQSGRRLQAVLQLCRACEGWAPTGPISCQSLDCPVLHVRHRAQEACGKRAQDIRDLLALLS